MEIKLAIIEDTEAILTLQRLAYPPEFQNRKRSSFPVPLG
jgi:hypothetical protein